ncbi:helix-turn-helix domain-containing protein [Mongoliitalea daihaiensis]|uniref:helix-turn-helix domain-containing protein n=1 Tax=Mongoliitalea daihaiensis TaxID=2782006 RepID=UPI001F28C6B7|nr:helix-turn-helix transcriptional regulator [Mongoliitalea daihaiensis]UJP65224.1 helix-turn-helix transcriptional regulator [Mongoliitalea daihaiensis]
MPYLLRTVNPLMFFAMPLFYFYVRNTVRQINGIKQWDWLHFIPGLLHYLELIPFYMIPLDEKRIIAEQLLKNPNSLDELVRGLVPGTVVDTIRILLQIGYYIASIKVIGQVTPDFLTKLDKGKLRNWLFVSVVLMGLLVFAHAGSFLLELLSNRGIRVGVLVYQFLLYGMLFAIAALSLYIQYNPEFVYGYQRSSSKGAGSSIPSPISERKADSGFKDDTIVDKIPADESLTYTNEKIDQFLQQKHYLRQEINAGEFADQIGVSKRQLSAFLKDHYGKGFKEWINYLRVQTAVSKIDDGYLDKFTIESLCMEVGFNSRITFFTVFKKEMGISPSEYAKQKID